MHWEPRSDRITSAISFLFPPAACRLYIVFWSDRLVSVHIIPFN